MWQSRAVGSVRLGLPWMIFHGSNQLSISPTLVCRVYSLVACRNPRCCNTTKIVHCLDRRGLQNQSRRRLLDGGWWTAHWHHLDSSRHHVAASKARRDRYWSGINTASDNTNTTQSYTNGRSCSHPLCRFGADKRILRLFCREVGRLRRFPG